MTIDFNHTLYTDIPILTIRQYSLYIYSSDFKSSSTHLTHTNTTQISVVL